LTDPAMSTPPTTVPARGRRAPWRFGAIVGFTIRSCIGPKRWLGCLLPSLGAILFGLLARGLDEPPLEAFVRVASTGVFGLTLPIAALVIGDAVFGAEIRSGVFHYTWMTPAPLTTIVLGRWLGGWLVALVTIVPATAIAALVAGVPRAVGPAAIGAAAGSGAYIAVFIAIGCIARRAAVWSLAFVFLVERLLGAALNGIAQLSPGWEARAIFTGLLRDVPANLVRKGIPSGGSGIVRLEVVTIVALVIARLSLHRLSLSGASD
jgi:ABC-type transport system involved in multi-copper enzyme maturation permease subunit